MEWLSYDRFENYGKRIKGGDKMKKLFSILLAFLMMSSLAFGAEKLRVEATTSTDEGIIVKGASGQTANLLEVQDSNGNLIVVIDAEGRLGIGEDPQATPIPVMRLGTDAYTNVRMATTDAAAYSNLQFYENSTFMGNFLLYGSNFSDSTRRSALQFSAGHNNAGKIIFRTKTGDVYYIRMEIQNDGSILFPSHGTTVGSANAYIDPITGELMRSTSSERYKTNIHDLGIDTSKVYKLRPVSFNEKTTGESHTGLIAEEVYEIFPELVEVDKEGRPDGVRYQLLSVLLLQELKKIKEELEQLKSNQAH